MNDTIYSHFSKTVDDYDTVSDKVVMKNDELHEQLIQAIPFPAEKPLRILDLGCGTGHGMLLVLNRFPRAHVTGVDFSPLMIEKSRKNLQAFANRVTLVEHNFNTLAFPETYDVVISAIAIHNSTHEQKDALFKKIFLSLKEDGVFINGDFIEGESFEINQQYRHVYRKYLEENLDGNELRVWLKHAFEEDMPLALSRQFGFLKTHGFRHITLLWQFNNEAVYTAKK